MKRIIDVIESKHWRNTKTGQTASIYGAVPYCSAREKENWIIEKRGYTWKNANGTIGIGRQPAKTYKEAVAVMEKINAL